MISSLLTILALGVAEQELSPTEAVTDAEPTEEYMCTNFCAHRNDWCAQSDAILRNSCSHLIPRRRDCDDGGFGSEYHLCTFGSDCSDCGPRTGSSRGIPSRYPSSGRGRSIGYGSRRCSNTCRHRNDGDCDDGGFGSEYHLCTFGSDCGDCGSRAMRLAEEPPAELAPEALVEQKHAKTISMRRWAAALTAAQAFAVATVVGLVVAVVVLRKKLAAARAAAAPGAAASAPML